MKSSDVIFTREHENDRAYKVDVLDENGESKIGPVYFAFDTRKVFNFWTDYPDKLTSDQKWAFDDTFPFWAKFDLTDDEAERLAKEHPNWSTAKKKSYDDPSDPYEQITKEVSDVEFVSK